ncbi:MAG: phytoene desaturase family protein [Myxococcota bacterium]
MDPPEPGPPEATRARARNPVPERADVAIVGAGLGGLTAGAYLARRGLRVAVLDGHYVAGGCGTVFGRGPKHRRYHFDVGLHYVGDCGPDGVIPSILGDLDIHVDWLPLDPDGFDTFVFPDLTFRVPADLDLYRQRLLDLFPSERKGIDRYIALVRQVGEVGRQMEATRGKMTPGLLWHVLRKGRLLARYKGATIGAFLDSCTKDPRLRAVMLGQNGDYGLPPSEASALLHCGLAAHYFHGAYYPRGGGQILADRLAATIEAHGGSIHLRRPVERILVEDGRAVGIVTEAPRHGEAETCRADLVLSNADLKRTMLDLVGPEHLAARWADRVGGFQMAAALFITCLGVEADLSSLGMRASNYWVFDDYDFDAMYRHAREAAEPDPHVAYITSATMKEPDNPHHAPPGVGNVEVMTVVPGDPAKWGVTGDPLAWDYKRDARYQALKQRVEDNMVACLERTFPGTAERIVYRESATPMTHMRFTRASMGTSYGIAATPDQMLDKRPGYRTPIRGLFLCGASTRAGHGIVGTMSSGRAAAQTILRTLGRDT